MAVLEKIRVRFGGVITAVIALALLSFIIDPNTLQSVSASMSSKYDVGEINGKSVSYNEFQKTVDYYTSIGEITSGSSVMTEQQQEQIRNEAWQSYVDKFLFLKNAKAAGIFVGEDELLALTTGEMVSPLISQNPIFMDETGAFSKDRLVQFVQNMNNDATGNVKAYWDYLQNTIINQQYYAKYGSLFSQSNYSNDLMVAKEMEENNNSTSAEFVMVPFGYEMDSTITVSDAEIKEYYNSHKKFYKQLDSRDIEYVVFEVVPSDDDIAAANEAVTSVYDEFASTDNMKSFLMRNSDRAYSEYYYKKGELNTILPEINDFVFDNKSGVSKVFTKDNTFYAARVMDVRKLPDSVFVQHILLAADQQNTADSLLKVLASGKTSFSSLAAQYSLDQNPNVENRGDIGWMTQTYMIPGFESVMTAELGKPFILSTQYGKHIVKVTDRTSLIEKRKVAILEKTATAGKATVNKYYTEANALAVKAEGKYDLYKKAVEESGLYSHPYNRMAEGNDRFGSIEHAKEVSRWAFEAKKGKVSNVISVDNKYFFVAALKDIHKEGYTPVEDAASGIKSIIYNRKRAEKKAAEVAEKIKGLDNMEAIAKALNTTVSKRDNITFATFAGQGLDPKFIGAVSVAPEGVISAPLAGNIGVYVYKVTGRETGAFYTEDDARNRDAQMSQYASRTLIPVMMQDAEVKDNRARFY